MLDISKLFELEIKPALGCTEPVAIAYATSLAYNAIVGKVPVWLKGKIPIKYVTDARQEDIEIDRIEISLSRGIFKNALAVGIPRSNGRKGIPIAAAMGIFCFPEAEGQEMALFKTLKPGGLESAEILAQRVKIKLIDGWQENENIQLKAMVKARHKQLPERVLTGTAKIEKTHSNVTSIDVHDSLEQVAKIPFERKSQIERENPDVKDRLKKMTIHEMVAELESLPKDVIEKMIEMIEMNVAISKEGLKEAKGLAIGTTLRDLVNEGYLGNDLITSAQIMVASAADARMGGFDYPVMSCAGSGNQGIAASLPIIAVAQKNGYNVKELLAKRQMGQLSKDEQRKLNQLVKALALSSIITCYITYHTKYLSALCGCVIKAGLGATAGIAYLLSESDDKVEMAIQNMAGNITGLICDGGKGGCSLKLTTSASVAIQSALLAMRGVQIPSGNGIIAEKTEGTIRNIGKICQTLIATDTEITRIMADKGGLKF